MAVMKFLIYLTCFGLSQDLVFCDDYGESGKEITLTPNIRGKPEEILWTLNDNKVLEYDGSQVDAFGSFKDRVEVDFETGQLKIRNLNRQDTGRYRSEIMIDKKQQVSRHNLTVLDALPDPRVTCEPGETTNDKTLTCSVESQTQLSYEWIGPDVKRRGQTLLVKEKEEKGNQVYTCIVKNKAATRTTDFALQDCHTVNLAVLVPVLIIVPLLIIVLVVLALYLCRWKKQKHAQKAELKRMDLENGVRDTLMENVEAVPGSLEATLPCRTRLNAPKESIADKKWSQGSESENEGENHEEEKLLKEGLQSAKTENEEAKENTNEEELEINQENCGSADEAGENDSSKTDETEEIQKQTQEGIEKSQILEDKEESSEEQTETPGEQDTADTNDEDQTPEEEEEKEDENEGSLNTGKTQTETLVEQDNTDTDTKDEDQTPEEKEEENSPNTGVCDGLMQNVEAVPGSLEATLPCRTRLTAPKESIADKKWSQGSESKNEGENHEEEKLLQESLQSAKTENEEAKENTNEEELEINQENCESADEAGDNDSSKADETEEIQKQTQEGIEKSLILKDESKDKEESSEEQTETQGEQDTADTNDEDQTPKKKEDEEKEYKEMDSLNTGKTQTETLGEQDTTDADTNDEDQTHEEKEEKEGKNSPNTVYTEDVAEQLHKNEKSSQNENRDQSAEQQNKCLDDRRPEEQTEQENHEGTSRPHTDSRPDLSQLQTRI